MLNVEKKIRSITLDIILWISVVAFSLIWNFRSIDGNISKIVNNIGRSFFKEIETTRLWNAQHGGVYVPITKETQPNPYLKGPGRDVTTRKGLRLTKVNPAFMTRQIAELVKAENNIQFHITSLKPIRPANKAEKWEMKALQEFETGSKEFFEFNQELMVYRYMASLAVKKACLKCHAKQGYKLGDIRGGISITIPAKTYLNAAQKSKNNIIVIHAIVLALVIGVLFLFRRFRVRLMELLNRKKRILNKAKMDAISANRSKSQFLANMNHEIRTPMNAIIGLNHLLMKTRLSPKQIDYVEKISLSAKNLLGIINDILDFSRIEAGKLSVEHVDFDLDDVLKNLTKVIQVKAQEKGLEVLIDQNKDVPLFLVGDPLRLGQILLNLSNNAMKFTEKGEVVVSVKPIKSQGNSIILQFSVQDTGIGLSQENMPLKSLIKSKMMEVKIINL